MLRALVPLLLILALTPGPVLGGGPDGTPEENTSFLREDAPPIRRAAEEAQKARESEDWNAFVRAWQTVVDLQEDPEVAGAAAPFVLPVRGHAVYEGAWRVAHHEILRAGHPALEAYEREFGPAVADLLARAARERGPRLLEEVVDRFLPLPAARRAALLLADLALEAGDRDAALGWLERLEDVEEVAPGTSGSTAAHLVEARITRMAMVLAGPGQGKAVQLFLDRSGGPEDSFDAVPPRLRSARVAATTWPTTGGSADRADLAPPIEGTLEPAWFASLEETVLEDDRGIHDAAGRPSPWVPPRAVTDGRWAFVSEGRRVEVLDALTGRRAARPFALEGEDAVFFSPYEGPSRRAQEGLLEGYALTLGPRTPHGRILYVAAPEPDSDGDTWHYAEARDDRLEALLWNGRTLRRLWRQGGTRARVTIPRSRVPRIRPTPPEVGGAPTAAPSQDVELPAGCRLYGAPLLYRGHLWIAGIVPMRGSNDQAEAWLFALDPFTGAVRRKTWLAAGPPVRGGRPDEAIPSSPAGAAGRVVVATSLGVIAAVDARNGRPHWALRYERGAVSSGRPRRLAGLRDGTERQSGFSNEPPLLALERVFAAPTDSPHLLFLFDRPRGSHRALVLWRLHRRFDFPRFAGEQIVGLSTSAPDGKARLILAGKGSSPEGDLPPPMVVALDALAPLRGELWRGVSTTGHGAETFGRALLTSREVVVPTSKALVIYDLVTGRVLQTADAGVVPPTWWEELGPGAELQGNLIPIPGVGILAVNDEVVVLWRRATR